MLPAMHTQTNLDQGLLQVPPSLPSHPLLTPKDKAANERIFVPTRKKSIGIKCDGGWER